MAKQPTDKQYALPAEIEKWTHVAVTWEDAMVDSGPHNSDEFVRNFRPCVRRSSGYVIGYTDRHIFVATTDDRDSNVSQDCEDVTVIPIAYVRRIMRR